MKCRDFETLLCDYLDGSLPIERRRETEDHARTCPDCAAALRDADFAAAFLKRAPAVEPPAELLADILHETIGIGQTAPAMAGGGASGFWGRLFQPVFQPRFVMSMAMTVLSLSMLTFYLQQAAETWRQGGASPAQAVRSLGAPAADLWDSAAEVFNATRTFYEMQIGLGGEEREARPSATPGPEETDAQPEEQP